MVRSLPIHVGADHLSSIPLAIGLFVSVSALVALCAKQAKRVPRKQVDDTAAHEKKMAPRSPLSTPKKLITTISNKSTPFIYPKKEGNDAEKVKQGSGEGGLWQKEILMGEKCQPPDFSGVIYYDSYGKRIAEMPRSPRAGPLRNF